MFSRQEAAFPLFSGSFRFSIFFLLEEGDLCGPGWPQIPCLALARECPLFSLPFICCFVAHWQYEGARPSLYSTEESAMGYGGKQGLGFTPRLPAPLLPPTVLWGPHRLEVLLHRCTCETPWDHARNGWVPPICCAPSDTQKLWQLLIGRRPDDLMGSDHLPQSVDGSRPALRKQDSMPCSRVLHVLGKHSTTRLHPQSFLTF